jgi:hypothetical protein
MFDPELLKQRFMVPVRPSCICKERGGRNLLFYIALGLEEYNPVYLNPFGSLQTVPLLIYTTGNNLSKLDILMNACGSSYFYAMVCL